MVSDMEHRRDSGCLDCGSKCNGNSANRGFARIQKEIAKVIEGLMIASPHRN